MRITEAPEGLDEKAYESRMIQILNAAVREGQTPDGLVINHITRYICRLNPSERTDLENQFMRQLQRVCLVTDLNDATQAATFGALINRKQGEPDLLPFYVNTVCRKPSERWRSNEIRLMQNRSCSKTPPAVSVDVVSIIPGPVVDLEPKYVVFLHGIERVEPTGRRDANTARMYIFVPARNIDTLVLQNGRSMRGMRVEGRLKGQVMCNVIVDHDDLIAILPLKKVSEEGYHDAGETCRRRLSSQPTTTMMPLLLVFSILFLAVAVWMAYRR